MLATGFDTTILMNVTSASESEVVRMHTLCSHLQHALWQTARTPHSIYQVVAPSAVLRCTLVWLKPVFTRDCD